MVRMKVGGVRREETQYLWRINLCLCSPSARKNINLHYIITITSNIFITNSQRGAPHREPSRAVLLQQVRAHAQAGGGTPNPGPSRRLEAFRVPPGGPVQAARTPAEAGARSAAQSLQISGLSLE